MYILIHYHSLQQHWGSTSVEDHTECSFLFYTRLGVGTEQTAPVHSSVCVDKQLHNSVCVGGGRYMRATQSHHANVQTVLRVQLAQDTKTQLVQKATAANSTHSYSVT